MTLERAAELIRAARRGVAFTGAGISQESGIPTFRGADGLWKKYDPMKVASIDYFMQDPAAYWRVARERGAVALAARPNPGHYALAALEDSGHLVAVVTQNTDGLHQESGSANVIELHGSGRGVVCLDCGTREPRAEVQARLATEMPPVCQMCGGRFLKPTVVLFGEALPQAEVEEARTFARRADLMLVIGSSLVVYPAAQIPVDAMRAGAPLVIVNDEPTPMDDYAASVVRGKSGEVLPELLARSCR